MPTPLRLAESEPATVQVEANTLGGQRVMIRCDERNIRGAAIPERLGFICEGRLRNSEITQDGHLRTMLVFSLAPDAPRWPQRK